MTQSRRYPLTRRLRPAFDTKLRWLALLCLPLAAACSGLSDSDEAGSGSGGTPGINITQSGGTGVGSGTGTGTGTSTGTGTGNNCATQFDSCAGLKFEPEGLPLDIYVMFDQSGSMMSDVGGLTRLAAVQQAVANFLRDPQSASTAVGIGYFGFLPIGEVSCDPATYGTPDVPVTLDHEAVIGSLNRRVPTGETPTAAALRGACGYAESYRAMHTDHKTVILLVTDGKPEAPASCNFGGCCPTLDDATNAAATCLAGKAQVPTYVLGVGPNLDNLQAIAQAGGTKKAYIVSDQNVAKDVLTALTNIRKDAQIPCDIEVPMGDPGSTVDYSKVNVVSSQIDCSGTTPIYHVDSLDKCAASGGWYYDNPAAPSRIQMCPTTCQLLNASQLTLQIAVGCASLPPPIR